MREAITPDMVLCISALLAATLMDAVSCGGRRCGVQGDGDSPPELQAAEQRLRQLQHNKDPPQRAQADGVETTDGKENAQGTPFSTADAEVGSTADVAATIEPLAPVTPEPLSDRTDRDRPGFRIRSNAPVLVHATGPKASGSADAAAVPPFVAWRSQGPDGNTLVGTAPAREALDAPVQPPIDADIAKESAELLKGLLKLTAPHLA